MLCSEIYIYIHFVIFYPWLFIVRSRIAASTLIFQTFPTGLRFQQSSSRGVRARVQQLTLSPRPTCILHARRVRAETFLDATFSLLSRTKPVHRLRFVVSLAINFIRPLISADSIRINHPWRTTSITWSHPYNDRCCVFHSISLFVSSFQFVFD